MVPPASHKVSRASWYSGSRSDSSPYSLRDSHPLWCRFPTASRLAHYRAGGPTTPADPKIAWFGLFPVRSPLLRESRLISLRRATEMFQFAHGPPPCLWIQHGVSRHHSGRVAPFGYSGLLARMQLPLNVSPVSASFIGLQRLGIHLVLCLACGSHWYARLVRSMCLLVVFVSCGDCSSARSPVSLLPPQRSSEDPTHDRATPLAFLCFSLLALGKIEVIVNVILICIAVVNVHVRDP